MLSPVVTCWQWPGLNLIMAGIRVRSIRSMSKVCYWWLLLELPKLDLTSSISNRQPGIVKDTQAWSYVTLSKFWELVVSTIDIGFGPCFSRSHPNLIYSLLGHWWAGRQISCRISVRQNPSTQTFKYISLHFPRQPMLRDNRTKRHEEESVVGNFVGFVSDIEIGHRGRGQVWLPSPSGRCVNTH